MGTIEVIGIRAIGDHGLTPADHGRGQLFEVDLRLEVDLSATAASDHLEDTVDYASVTEAVARVVELESYRLLERLGDRIAGICMTPTVVTAVEVTVRRLRPSIPVEVRSIAVTINRRSPSSKEHCGSQLVGPQWSHPGTSGGAPVHAHTGESPAPKDRVPPSGGLGDVLLDVVQVAGVSSPD